MEGTNYKSIIRELGPIKALGQSFLISNDIAAIEAKYASDRNVVELGPGLGILTKELCRTAKRVVAVEKDSRLIDILKETIESERLQLIEGDFFSIDPKRLGKIDIMVSNIPYNLSSKVVYWLSSNRMPAVICMQKEFTEHMLAKPGMREYSKLSVISSLTFTLHNIREVHSRNFYPVPRVDSRLVYLVPKPVTISEDISLIITLLMNHKKKILRNAVVDSADALGLSKKDARMLASKLEHADSRPLHMSPELILETSKEISGYLNGTKMNK